MQYSGFANLCFPREECTKADMDVLYRVYQVRRFQTVQSRVKIDRC